MTLYSRILNSFMETCCPPFPPVQCHRVYFSGPRAFILNDWIKKPDDTHCGTCYRPHFSGISLTQDFELQRLFQIFSKICSDIHKSMFISCVNNTGDKRGKFGGVNFLNILWRAYLSALYSCWLNCCLFLIFRSRQAGIVSIVSSAVSLTPSKKFIGGFIGTSEQFFGGVVVTGDKF